MPSSHGSLAPPPPEGVAAVEPGDTLVAKVDGVGSLQVQIVAE